ncbi:MAG: Hsp20/alpha crystallin family protein [Bacteroidetes bacterium]|nr:Hsp20/alpha crystallin family protein [Bacteroidota bacterium]
MRVKTPAFVPSFFNVMDKFMADDFSPAHFTTPPVNILEKEKNYSIELMAPGLDKSDFKIELDNHLLTISFQKTTESTEESPAQSPATEKFIKKEFSIKSFKRTFTVNEHLKLDEITAKYENGILSVDIPKVEVKEKEVKTISIN